MVIREVRPSDDAAWESMRCDLWPDGAHEHAGEIASFLAGKLQEPSAVFLAEDEGSPVGVIELSIRDHVPGFAGKRTGYVEGLYVVPQRRGSGIARELLRVAKQWASDNHCDAFASDRADRLIIDRGF